MFNIFDDLNDTDVTDKQESAEFVKALIDNAEKGEHRKLDFARNPGEFSVLKTLSEANEKLVYGFDHAAAAAMKDYITKLKNGIDDLKLLFNYRTFKKCATYYQVEHELAADRVSEYLHYLFNGHLIDTYLLFRDRTDEDMFDYRTGERLDGEE